MKKMILFCTLLVSSFAFANDPQTEPGPVMKMGDDAVELTRMLLNRQLSKCVDEFQRYDVSISDVTVQRLAPGSTYYQVNGVVLVGGDVATGRISLNISKRRVKATYGFGTMNLYTCNIVKD